jgi:hypothetical protein
MECVSLLSVGSVAESPVDDIFACAFPDQVSSLSSLEAVIEGDQLTPNANVVVTSGDVLLPLLEHVCLEEKNSVLFTKTEAEAAEQRDIEFEGVPEEVRLLAEPSAADFVINKSDQVGSQMR